MLEVKETKVEEKVSDWMTIMCNGLFGEWSMDLTPEEKEIWLWNASVEMLKIKRRRNS